MTPFPPFGWGFTPGVSSVTPSLGVSGFVLGVVVTVGYRPTGSSVMEANSLPEAPTQAPNTYAKLGPINLTHKTPRSGVTPP
jgi:hypothetical protein